ncbi:MAG: putative bifunctional diguanylate cyclase/phosphodiesterase [Burkholderiaceae bacterium]
MVAAIVLGIAFLAIGYVASRYNPIDYLPDSIGSLLPDPLNHWDWQDASRRFDTAEGVLPLQRSSSLTFRTVWLKLDLSTQAVRSNQQLTIEALRAKNARFWALTSRGQVIDTDLRWTRLRNGIAVDLPARTLDDLIIIGRIEPVSLNRIRFALNTAEQISRQEYLFERAGGLLIGAMLMVALFSLVVAIFDRDPVFFLYGAWLITSLRIAAYNGNWDPYWLDIPLQGDVLQLFLRLTYVAHSFISLALFERLFRKELQAQKLTRILRGLQAVTLIMILPVVALDLSVSVKLLWMLSSATILLVFGVLAILSVRQPSRTLFWYIGSWLITLMGSVVQIAYATGLANQLIEFVNSQSTTIASALMLGITLAQKMNAERRARIAAQHRATAALERFRDNYNAMPVGIFAMKPDGTIIEHNPMFGVMFSDPDDRRPRVGHNWARLASPAALEAFARLSRPDQMMDTELLLERVPGGRRWFHMRGVRKSDRYEAWIEEITSRKEAEGHINFLVDHDSLTGLLNRRGFELHLSAATSAVTSHPICIAYVDLDKFKLINELFGHAAGDQILRQMATRMREVVQPPHLLARIGGDEFAVIIDALALPTAETLCHALRRELSDRPYQYQDKAFSVAASIGLVRLRQGMRPADVLTASDRACAEAKRSGAGVVTLDASSSTLIGYLDEIKMIAGMKERMPVENFFMQMQPIVSLRDASRSLCYEVLLRMRDEQGQTVLPSRFIPAAERNGLMTQIDRWVLRNTLEWLDDQPLHRSRIDFCTLNLSGASLNDDKFLQDAIALILEHREAASKVCFEITESVALYDLKTTRRFVDRVKSFGARVALDDFGAGYTSFNYLKELPGDLVKIDGSFIRDINLNPANFAITRAIVDLSHQLGMACVAEWAENDEIIRSLRDLQVDFGQGYGLSRPLDPERLLAAESGLALIREAATVELLSRPASPATEAVSRQPAPAG